MEEKQMCKILLVEDDNSTVKVIQYILKNENVVIEHARNGEEGLEKMTHFYPHIIICDIMMPVMNGYEFRDRIRDRDDRYLIPFIFLSAKAETEDRVKGLEYGVDMYVTKPFHPKEFVAIVKAMFKRRIELERLINFDALTTVFNKRKIMADLDMEIARMNRYSHPLSIIVFDIDLFKNINDTYGHTAGDIVLARVSAKIKELIRDIDLLGRIGGEEFLLIMPNTDKKGARILGERLRQEVADLVIGQDEISVTISGGIATGSTDGAESGVLFNNADKALYEAKENGRNRIC